MAWIEKLHATYEACKGREPPGTAPLMPISHTPQQAHIEIAIDGQGNFKSAKILQKEETVIPATEEVRRHRSAGQNRGAIRCVTRFNIAQQDYRGLWRVRSRPFFNELRGACCRSWCESVSFVHPKAERGPTPMFARGHVVADSGDGKGCPPWARARR
jgi:CRISPR-associated protein Csd1